MSSESAGEAARLRLLADYGVMDTAPDEVLDSLVALASTICDAPISLVSLVDSTRQWFKARVGLDAQETPRELAFCAHAIAPGAPELFEIPDARLDPRFTNNPLVTGDPRIVFYAGAPLVAEGGVKLGTLCVIDTRPRKLDERQQRSLAMIAGMVVKRLQEVRARSEELAATRRYEATLTSIGEAVITADVHGNVTFLNPAASELTGWSSASAIGRSTSEVFEIAEEKARVSVDPIRRVVASGLRSTLSRTFLMRKDRSEVPIDVTMAPILNDAGVATGVILVARDQSEALHNENELIALSHRLEVARRRLETVFENAPAFVCSLRGPTHIYEMANRPYRQLVGMERVLIGRTVADALPEVVSQGFVELLDRVFATGETVVSNEAVPMIDRQQNGTLERAYVNLIYQPWRDNDVVAGIDIFGFDITDQVVARNQIVAQQVELQARADQLRFTIEAASAGTWDLDATTGEIESNARMVELMGLAKGDTFTMKSGLARLPDYDRDAVTEAVLGALAGKNGGAYRMEFRTGENADAPLRWVESRAQAYFDANGQPLRLAGVMIDITTRKLLEAEQQKTSALIAQLLDSMSDGFLAIDKNWVLVTANQQFETISTLKREDVIGRNFWDVFPLVQAEGGATWTNYNRCMNERVPVSFESYYRKLDRWTDQRANPTEDGGIAVFFRDITKDKRAALVIEQQAAFERQLIGIVSHDLRTPLSVVTMASTLLHEAAELSSSSKKLVARSEGAALRATAMIRDLLDFTQARIGGGIRVERESADVEKLTRGVLDELEAAYPKRVIAFRSQPCRANVDSGRFAQVVQNLVSNALKYSPADSTVSVKLDSVAGDVVLTVHNGGAPIPGQLLPVLFEPFERGATQTDAVTRSVGLGLYIVKQIVEGHHGRITVTSTSDGGTTFTVTLPPH